MCKERNSQTSHSTVESFLSLKNDNDQCGVRWVGKMSCDEGCTLGHGFEPVTEGGHRTLSDAAA